MHSKSWERRQVCWSTFRGWMLTDSYTVAFGGKPHNSLPGMWHCDKLCHCRPGIPRFQSWEVSIRTVENCAVYNNCNFLVCSTYYSAQSDQREIFTLQNRKKLRLDMLRTHSLLSPFPVSHQTSLFIKGGFLLPFFKKCTSNSTQTNTIC